MISSDQRRDFESWVEHINPPLAQHPLLSIAALMTSAAYSRPVLQMEIFSAIDRAVAASGDMHERAAHILASLPWLSDGKPRTEIPRTLWDEFWKIIDVSADDLDGELDLTLRVVALGLHYDQRLIDECEQALLQFESVSNLIAQPEVRLKTSDLEHHAEDTLATELLNMLTANGYDIEVIDADTVLLQGDYPAQNRTNRRILQLHDIWHLVGGYGFTGAGEVAISGFQLAQFGQNYSTRFLATVMTKAAIQAPEFAPLLLQVMLDGWRHGRAATPLIDAPWHELIADPISAIRTRYGLAPIDSEAVKMMDSLSALKAVTAPAS
jgi:ubiquinone biosynthesis protein Coq4